MLQRLKEKTLRWHFNVKHRPGKDHRVADATSRNPTGDVDDGSDDEYDDEVGFLSNLTREYQCNDDENEDIDTSYVNSVIRRCVDDMKIKALTWERIKAEMSQVVYMKELLDLVVKGLPQHRREMPPHLKEYWEYRDSIYAVGEVLMVKY